MRTILFIQFVVLLAMASFAQQNTQSNTNRPVGATYELGPDSLPQPGVPKGKLEGPFLFKSQIITNTGLTGFTGFWLNSLKIFSPLTKLN